MKSAFLLFTLFLLSFIGYSQPYKSGPPPQKEEIFTLVEQMPEFPNLADYLKANIHYPVEAVRNNIQGVVYVQFIVRATGKVTDAVVMKGIGYGCDEEALRVVKSFPNWKPGRQAGRAVPVRVAQPIRFYIPPVQWPKPLADSASRQ